MARALHDTMGVLRRVKESREYLRLDMQLGKLIDQATRQVRMVLLDLLHPCWMSMVWQPHRTTSCVGVPSTARP